MRIDFGKDCIGCGACVGACPEVFEFDTDVYKVKVNIGADFSQHMAAIREARCFYSAGCQLRKGIFGAAALLRPRIFFVQAGGKRNGD